MDLQPGIYQHYKGGEYRVLFLAADHETQELLVVYVPLEKHGFHHSRPQVRPLATLGKDSWTDIVEQSDGVTVQRFAYVSP
jgi:hypothetical protein